MFPLGSDLFPGLIKGFSSVVLRTTMIQKSVPTKIVFITAIAFFQLLLRRFKMEQANKKTPEDGLTQNTPRTN